jgi:predicted outer membrane repeat protein
MPTFRLAFGLLLALVAACTHAAVFNVTTTTDGGPGSLRQAIIDANASPGADTINVPAGVYILTIAGANENAAATGDLDISEDVTIIGAGSASTIIDGGGLDRVFDVRFGVTNATMSGLTIRNGLINGATGNFGGGINAAGGTTVTLTDVVVTGNFAFVGAGIASNGTVILNASAVTNNVNNSASNSGGGITAATLIATNSTISGNSAPGQGGGIFVNSLTLDRSTVSNNTSTGDQGGGVFTCCSGGAVNITNSTISGNSSAQEGGGWYDNAPISGIDNVLVLNSTIANNHGQSGGGIFTLASSGLKLKNTIIAGNTATGSAPDCAGTFDSLGHNLIQNTTNCTLNGITTGNITGQNALLGPLANNGGPTQTQALLPGSPAIDTADPNGAPATDQRGVARPVGAGFDIGAFEASVGGSQPTLSIADVSANEGNSGSTPFVFTVTLSAASASSVTVDYATANGTATAGSDYVATSGTLTFAPGVTSQTITVDVIGDTTVESNETFVVNLSNASGAGIAKAQATGTILDDDATVPPPPAAPTPIPTLSEWSLLLLASMLGGLAAVRLRRGGRGARR